MLLKLFNSRIQTTDRFKHLIVLLFVAVSLLQRLSFLFVYFGDNGFKPVYFRLVVGERLLELASGCDSLHRHAFLSFDFISETLYFVTEHLVIAAGSPQQFLLLIELCLEIIAQLRLFSEHFGQQL